MGRTYYENKKHFKKEPFIEIALLLIGGFIASIGVDLILEINHFLYYPECGLILSTFIGYFFYNKYCPLEFKKKKLSQLLFYPLYIAFIPYFIIRIDSESVILSYMGGVLSYLIWITIFIIAASIYEKKITQK